MNLQKKYSKLSPFIEKLKQMLEKSENSEIIRLNQKTKRLDIVSKKKMEKILPNYFRHARFESFVRQLNWYGFHKVNSKFIHSYEHPQLQQGFTLNEIKSTRKKLESRGFLQQHKNSEEELRRAQKRSEKNNIFYPQVPISPPQLQMRPYFQFIQMSQPSMFIQNWNVNPQIFGSYPYSIYTTE